MAAGGLSRGDVVTKQHANGRPKQHVKPATLGAGAADASKGEGAARAGKRVLAKKQAFADAKRVGEEFRLDSAACVSRSIMLSLWQCVSS